MVALYNYVWDIETGGYLLDTKISGVTKELRPVFHEELDLLGFKELGWEYEPSERPLLWAETRRYIYKGELVAEANGGGLYTKPTIKIHKSPLVLEPVDVGEMIKRNNTKMLALIQHTAGVIYDKYNEYENKVDVVYVAFSGGKDSIVLLDMVQRSLPNEAKFKVIFSDTSMEVSDTYKAVEITKNRYKTVEFYTAKSHMDASDSWVLFAPPAKFHRWCCAVHKSVPSLLLLKKLSHSNNIKALVFDGVRADESDSRASYEIISDGHKHNIQINCSPILNWGSDEIFLYLLENNLMINNAYRKGSPRVGCALCPMSSPWRDYITNSFYQDDVKKYTDIITQYAHDTGITDSQLENYLQNSGWRNRAGGRGLKESNNLIVRSDESTLNFIINVEKDDWQEWIKTICSPIPTGNISEYYLEYNGIRYILIYSKGIPSAMSITGIGNTISDKHFVYCMKNIMGKISYCVGCRACEVECPTGAIQIMDGKTTISDKCIRCEKCLNKSRGCYAAKSFYSTNGGKNMDDMKGIHRYGTFGFRYEWLKLLQQHGNTEFWNGNKLGPDQYEGFEKWLIDAEIFSGDTKNKRSISRFGSAILDLPLNSTVWSLIVVNLSYKSKIFKWYIKSVRTGITYSKNDFIVMIDEDPKKKRTITNALTSLISTIIDTPVGNEDLYNYKENKGEITLNGLISSCNMKGKNVISITRTAWQNPEPLIILYSLYKFAENCDGHYGFTLSYLCDDSVEREGISPTRIFGLSEDTMKRLLVNLSREYPDFLNIEFVKDLDNIDLSKHKTSIDVLKLMNN